MKFPKLRFVTPLLLFGILPVEIATANPMPRLGETIGFPVPLPAKSQQKREGKTVSHTSEGSLKSRNAPATPLLAMEAETVTGKLDTNSDTLDDGSYYNVHPFEGVAGESIFIELTSEEFDPYLLLLDSEGNKIAENDDGGEGKNARIVLTLNSTGSYQIVARSYSAGELGNYTLSWGEASAIDFRKAEAERLLQEGRHQLSQSQFREALETFQQALTRFQEIGDRSEEGTTLYGLGEVYDDLGQYPKAIEYYEQALAIQREVGNRSGEGTTLNNLGAGLFHFQGQLPKEMAIVI